MRKLYLITQQVDCGYDTYDSAVVCADNPDEAKLMHPQEVDPKDVKVEYIGIANRSSKKGVILASFNAG